MNAQSIALCGLNCAFRSARSPVRDREKTRQANRIRRCPGVSRLFEYICRLFPLPYKYFLAYGIFLIRKLVQKLMGMATVDTMANFK